MEGCTREEEGIAICALALLTELLEVPHLTNGHSPMDQDPFVQTPSICELGRPCLERNGVANQSREVLVIQPSNRVLVGLDTDGNTVVTSARFAFLFVCIVVPPNVPTANHEDVSLLQGRSLPLQRLFNLHNRNLMPRHSRWCLPVLFLIPPHPITQNSSPYDATPLTPVMRSISVRLRGFRVRQPVIVCAAGLVGEMLETVPLRTGLCVDVHLVVHSLPVREVREVDLLLMELFAAEARELHVVKRPVELNVLAGADFFGGGFNDSGSE